jgi:hypothetical protein
MLMEIVKGFGYALVVIAFVGLWLVPDPIGKIVEIWRFFRGDRLD